MSNGAAYERWVASNGVREFSDLCSELADNAMVRFDARFPPEEPGE